MIEIKGLTKKYGSFVALDHLDLTVNSGVVFGFVGANGAGKSTTFSILATLLAPDEGDALIDGKSIRKNSAEVRRKIGYMPDFFGVYDQLKADEYLEFFASSYGMSDADIQKQIPKVLELVNLTDKKREYVDDLSRGMKQRLCLARTLMHDPEVLILDEPASGLDPRARVEMRDVLHALKEVGKTILISSHILPELAEMCDEIGVIDQGKLIAHGDIKAIQKQLSQEKTIHMTLLENADTQTTMAFLESKQLKAEVEGQVMTIQFDGEEQAMHALLKEALQQDLPIVGFAEQKKDLEDVFMAITKGED